jgi:hypothetical protein
MPKVFGTVKNDLGVPQGGLRAELWYFNAFFGLRRADETTTAPDGTFTLQISIKKDVWIGGIQFGLHVRIKSYVHRVLFKSPERDRFELS